MTDSDEGTRIQKVLADAGIASRRAAEDLIRQGRVTLNGRKVVLGQRAKVGVDRLKVDGQRVDVDPGKHYYMVNKPAGVVTTAKDPQGRKTVLDLFGEAGRVFPVGRLDMATEGLLLVTNDGDLAHKLSHPSFGVEKIYLAQVEGTVTNQTLRELVEKGVKIDRGRPAHAVKVIKVDSIKGRSARSTIEITVHEGRKHVVRAMMAAVGHPVKDLVRIGYGPLKLGRLMVGSYRTLTPDEVTALYREVDS